MFFFNAAPADHTILLSLKGFLSLTEFATPSY